MSAWLMVLFGGLFGGHLDGRRRASQLVAANAHSAVRSGLPWLASPIGSLIPTMGGLSGAAAAVYAWHSHGRPAVLAWAGVVLILLIIVASIALAEPIS
jgi:hypothetical protein